MSIVTDSDAVRTTRLKRLDKARAPSLPDQLLAVPQDGGSFERLSSDLRAGPF